MGYCTFLCVCVCVWVCVGVCVCVCVYVGGGAWRGRSPHSVIFFEPPIPPPHGVAPSSLKNESLPLKSKVPFQEMIPRKKPKKSEIVINTCISLIKQHRKKMAEIPQKRDYLTWSIQIFVRKVKQFVRKYYITWLIYLANKLCDIKKYLDFILCHVLLKIVLFY